MASPRSLSDSQSFASQTHYSLAIERGQRAVCCSTDANEKQEFMNLISELPRRAAWSCAPAWCNNLWRLTCAAHPMSTPLNLHLT